MLIQSVYFSLRKRNALVTTLTLEKAIAAPANTGDNNGPPKQYKSPAATGIPSEF